LYHTLSQGCHGMPPFLGFDVNGYRRYTTPFSG
jgi:hypothetical protein